MKGPLMMEMVTQVWLPARNDMGLILPKLLVVTRSCDENGKMKVDYYLSNANPDTPLEELARVPRLDPDKYTERRKINQQVSHTGKIQHFHELLPQEREQRVAAMLQQSMQARQLQAVAIKLLPGLPQPKAFVVDVEPETEVTNTTARHKLFGTLRLHSQYQKHSFFGPKLLTRAAVIIYTPQKNVIHVTTLLPNILN